MRDPVEPVGLDDIELAHGRITAAAIRTPLVPLSPGPPDGPSEIYLKLETLQPIGSFKIRGASNAMAAIDPARLGDGVYTASAGNMAQGVAWNARRLGIPCTVIVPDHAPAAKLDAVEAMGARIVKVPFGDWWSVLQQGGAEGMPGQFIHPVSDPAVIAGNGTIGLEILEDLPEVDVVVVPFGGGGLSAGIGCALRGMGHGAAVWAAEVATAAPLAPSLEAGVPVSVQYTPSFVDGIGSSGVLGEMWPLVEDVVAGSAVVSLDEIASAIRTLIESAKVVAEGAGASAVAAALSGRVGGSCVVCVVSGGNIDHAILAKILRGETP